MAEAGQAGSINPAQQLPPVDPPQQGGGQPMMGESGALDAEMQAIMGQG